MPGPRSSGKAWRREPGCWATCAGTTRAAGYCRAAMADCRPTRRAMTAAWHPSRWSRSMRSFSYAGDPRRVGVATPSRRSPRRSSACPAISLASPCCRCSGSHASFTAQTRSITSATWMGNRSRHTTVLRPIVRIQTRFTWARCCLVTPTQPIANATRLSTATRNSAA